MKKNLFILAVAALTLASCSSDETTAVNDSLNQKEEISFRPIVNGVTRAADANLSTDGKTFMAYAKLSSDGTTNYFPETVFTNSSGTFTSTTKYYWPSSGNLDFYAYAPTTSTQFTHSTTESLAFTVTPSSTISDQIDLIVANTNNKDKNTYGATGVALNFRHAESKVVVRFTNSSTLTCEVSAFKIVNVDGTATYTYTKTNNTSTDTQNTDPTSSGTTLSNEWTGNGDSYSVTYTATPTATNSIAANTSTAVYLQNDGTATTTANEALNMILIPQTTTAVPVTDGYSAATAGSALVANKTYIAVKMTIKNGSSTIADCTTDNKWAIWPVAFTWVPGKKYIYTIDLGNGGYWEQNVEGSDANLDKVLYGTEIKFVNVTVDDWDNSESTVAFP